MKTLSSRFWSTTHASAIAATLVSLTASDVSLAQSFTAATAPVGFTTITCPGASDTLVSTPLDRLPVYTGNGTFSASDGVPKIIFADSSFSASQFKYVKGVQSNTYFARIKSGMKEGSFYTITDNDASSVTFDLNGDDLSAVTSAASVAIIPYWTLATLFPDGQGVTPSGLGAQGTQILLPDTRSAGIDLAPAGAYFYSSRAATWYNLASTSRAGDRKPTYNDFVLYPDNSFIVRNNGASATSVVVSGAVVTTKLSIPLSTNSASQQDNAISLMRPVPVTLNDSGLIVSGAFATSTGSGLGDQLFVFDNAAVSFNKPPTATYTYANGAWQKLGSSGDAGGDAVFTPGSGVIIRKQVASAGLSVIWVNFPNY